MSKYRQSAEDADLLSGVNIIPVIDVSLVLLIILLATSPILNLPGFEVKLPKALTAESKEKNIRPNQRCIYIVLVFIDSLMTLVL